jgi:hypothetical protein
MRRLLLVCVFVGSACLGNEVIDDRASPISHGSGFASAQIIDLQQPCGSVQEPCCVAGQNTVSCDNGLVCGQGNVCVEPQPPGCGGAGEACCNGTSCTAGLVCHPPVCQGQVCGVATCENPNPPPPPPPTCGGQGQVCCNQTVCNQGLSCSNGTCL